MNIERILAILITLTFLIYACQNEEVKPSVENEKKTLSTTDELQMSFAESFSSALSESKSLRELLKKEALKQFDKDYDILYHNIKNEIIDQTTVGELVKKQFESDQAYFNVVNKLPLLNIYVPELPEFNAESWNANSEIPAVAVVLLHNTGLTPLIDAEGEKHYLNNEMIPAFPTIVIKQNERVFVKSSLKSSSSTGAKFEYEFIDDTFNGSITNTFLKSAGSDALQWYESDVNTVAYKAYEEATVKGENNLWQRDYVYYGLDVNKNQGAYKNNVSEFIFGIKPTSGDAAYKMGDQGSDPILRDEIRANNSFWTEGHFELVFNIIINSKNGVGDVLVKRIPVKHSDIFSVSYKKEGSYFRLTQISPKWYYPHTEIIPWDLLKYGDAWKIILSEYDPSETIENTVSHTSTFSGNFSVEGIIKKIGFKLGRSKTTSETTSNKVTTTLTSDELGEAIITFDQPCITDFFVYSGLPYIRFRTISTGWFDIIIRPYETY